MKTKNRKFRIFSVLTVILIIVTFALSLSAQKKIGGTSQQLAEDMSKYPHDFNDKFYLTNGVYPKGIIGRRTGTDFLSVFSFSSNPIHRNVRVLATLPAYSTEGGILFWSPLGELNEESFTQDATGVETREIANTYPIYVFPKLDDPSLSGFTNTRQAAIIDETKSFLYFKGNPLGLRLILSVNFTDKAFNTKDGFLMMENMKKKNGLSLDGTPLIKNTEEIAELEKYEFISIQKISFHEQPMFEGAYAISPVIAISDFKGAIALDAFLLTVTRDGRPLPGEMMLFEQFECIQKTGTWCEN